MSEENVEIVRQYLEAEANRDATSVLALLDPGVEMDFSRSPFADFAPAEQTCGVEAVRGAFRAWYDAWTNVVTDLHELIDTGEQVISIFSYRGRGRSSGVEVEWRQMAGVWTIREGRVVRVEWLRSRAEALEALGSGG